MIPVRLVAALSLALLLAGCAAGPDYRPPTLDLPAHFRQAVDPPAAAAAAAAAPWWRRFDDPQLDALEASALAQNLDLAQASARLAQARAAAGLAHAARRPSGRVGAQAARERLSLANSTGIVIQAFPQVQRSGELYDADVGASWELDLFGGLGRSAQAARAELDAAHAGVTAARLMVSAEVAEAYVRLRGDQQRIGVLDRQIALLRERLALVRLRAEEGAAAQRELDAAAAELAQAEAMRPALAAAAEGELDRLAVLIARPPEADRRELGKPAPIPHSAAALAGAPADLLRRRPDLIAAERRLAAANARIGAAIAEYYPKVSLQGLLGAESLDAATLFTGRAALSQAVVGLRWRLFDFQRVSAEVAMARGREAEALAAYRQAVLRAAADVEAALTARLATAEQARRLADARQDLERRRTATADAYAAGAASLLEVMDADRQALAAEDHLLQAEVGQALAEVALARGTGGPGACAAEPPMRRPVRC